MPVGNVPVYCHPGHRPGVHFQNVTPCEWVPDQVRDDTVVMDAGSEPGMTSALYFTFNEIHFFPVEGFPVEWGEEGCRGRAAVKP